MSHFVLATDLDRSVLNFWRASLQSDDVQVIAASSRADAMARAAAWQASLAIVGTRFGAETVSLVRDLRREFSLRSIVAARDGEDEILAAALEAGAVGFVVLPLARAAAARRVREHLLPRTVTNGRYVTAGPVTLDLDRRSLVRPRTQASLTPVEFEMLRWLLMQPGRSFTRRQLLAAKRESFPPKPTAADVDRQVASLRRKLGEAGGLIEKAGAVGWRFSLATTREAEVEFPLTNVNYEI